MKSAICKIVSIIMLMLAAVLIICAITVSGSGFLDLSNIARLFLIGASIVSMIAAAVTGICGWHSDKQ